jgi:hypothetical protein
MITTVRRPTDISAQTRQRAGQAEPESVTQWSQLSEPG